MSKTNTIQYLTRPDPTDFPFTDSVRDYLITYWEISTENNPESQVALTSEQAESRINQEGANFLIEKADEKEYIFYHPIEVLMWFWSRLTDDSLKEIHSRSGNDLRLWYDIYDVTPESNIVLKIIASILELTLENVLDDIDKYSYNEDHQYHINALIDTSMSFLRWMGLRISHLKDRLPMMITDILDNPNGGSDQYSCFLEKLESIGLTIEDLRFDNRYALKRWLYSTTSEYEETFRSLVHLGLDYSDLIADDCDILMKLMYKLNNGDFTEKMFETQGWNEQLVNAPLEDILPFFEYGYPERIREFLDNPCRKQILNIHPSLKSIQTIWREAR